MKINIVPTIIATLLAALIAYACYAWCQSESQLLLSIGTGICMELLLVTLLGMSFATSRTSVNVKAITGVFLLGTIIGAVVFCCLSSFSVTAFVLTVGIEMLLWLLIIYFIVKANQ